MTTLFGAYKMSRFTLIFLTLFALGSSAFAGDKTITIKVSSDSPTTEAPFKGKRPSVDVAILLDTSNSMDGLIKQAKTQLWTIVQQFAEAEKNGQTPSLRVALFEYGNTRLPALEGYIRQVVQLTDDLDALSEALFSLKTNGGDEYCGQVIKEAVKRLDWSSEPNSYKAIFIAGNEPFTQGSVDYRKACKKAIGRGIIVNTIHCGSYSQGVNGKWEAGAKLAEGKYLNIDQDEKVIHIDCPQDKVIIQLNAELNKTYLWYGTASAREQYRSNQVAQDQNAAGLSSGVLLKRAVVKGGRAYNNARRDLVDALAENDDAFGEIAEAQLPSQLQKLSEAERVDHVKGMAAKRKELQQQIVKLNRERLAYLAEQKKLAAKNAPAAAATLGDAVLDAVQTQLKASGFEVRK